MERDQERGDKVPRNHAMTAALIGGAAAATAGAIWGARTLARRGRGDTGPVNAVMETALTASEVSRRSPRSSRPVEPAKSGNEPSVPAEPSVPREPSLSAQER